MNHAHLLKQVFDQFYEAPVEAWEDFAACCTEMVYPKGAIIKPINGILQHFHFMLAGSVGVFVYKEHTQICLDLAYDYSFVGDISMYSGKPSPTELVALEPCTMLRMTMTDYRTLCTQPWGSVLCRVGSEVSLFYKQQQQIDLMLKTAEERYRELLQGQPDVILRTPQKIIASYLGITPQSLSRIRKGVSGGE
jgi:CRP-like cAMP-binding protein